MFKIEKGLFLHQVRHSDSRFVVHLFCRDMGFVSGVFRKPQKRSMSVLQPFSLLEVKISDQENKDLRTISSLSRVYIPESIDADVRKSTVAIFLTEILFRSIHKGYTNAALFDFIEKAVIRFDKLDFQVNFHLWFMCELSRFYGMYPRRIEKGNCLDFELGEIAKNSTSAFFTRGEEVETLSRFLGMEFDESMVFEMTRSERLKLMDLLIEYISYHHQGLKHLNSREIFELVFS